MNHFASGVGVGRRHPMDTKASTQDKEAGLQA
jgi:hypothetical protein